MGLSTFKNVCGQVFGRLKAISRIGVTKHGNSIWTLRCICGRLVIATLPNLTSRHVQSCGCLLETQDGLTGEEAYTYASYRAMIRRCYDTEYWKYKDYGMRGINVYFDWLGAGGFKKFLEYMGRRPIGLTLDRIRNSGHYEPGNLRWSTYKMQAMNRRPRVQAQDASN